MSDLDDEAIGRETRALMRRPAVTTPPKDWTAHMWSAVHAAEMAELGVSVLYVKFTHKELARLLREHAERGGGLVVCGARSHGESRWPCSKEPGHIDGHENAASYWPRRDSDTCAAARSPLSAPQGTTP